MSTPDAPPLPAPPNPNGPAPLPAQAGAPDPAPAPAPAAPAPPAAVPAADGAAELAELRATLDRERAKTREVEKQLAQLRQQGMTDQEKAVADAKAAGRKEAAREAGLRVAEAEFRALATGKLADPGKMLEDGDLNLARFVDDDGNVDKRALGKLVDRLAAAAAPVTPAGPGVPAGPRGGAGETDFLRAAMQGHPRM